MTMARRVNEAGAMPAWRRVLTDGGGGLALVVCLLVLSAGNAWTATKVDTKPFNAFFSSQSGKIYDHLLKVTDYYATLVKEGNAERIKDVLALRASLSACWELYLNAGDMVYVYDLLDPTCAETVTKVGGLLQNGLRVIAGKLDKEVQWMRLVEKNVADLPVSVELGQAMKDIQTAATYFRQTAPLFAPPAGSETRQPVGR